MVEDEFKIVMYSEPRPSRLVEYDLTRFWSRVDKTSDPNGCWIWKGARTAGGYGQVRACRQAFTAHRVSYQLTNGPIPKAKNPMDACVLHTCDNRLCVNPDHLYLGPQSENIYDRDVRGRHVAHSRGGAKGEKNVHAKLNIQQVLEIRKRAAAGETRKNIAAIFKVTLGQVSFIVNRKSWAHI